MSASGTNKPGPGPSATDASGADSPTADAPGTDPVQRLLALMARLRDPEGGCPWDLAQTFSSIAPYTVEEAHEVADAIERADFHALREELGDLLFQVIFHARMAEEKSLFDFHAVADGLLEKIIRRHPHVFGGRRYASVAEQQEDWEAIKAAERAARGETDTGLLSGISRGLPALRRSQLLQARAATVGFDWPSTEPMFDKLAEETAELKAAIAHQDADNIEEEVGDLFFALTNLARRLDVDPEQALRRCNHKFERRFHVMEEIARERALNLADLPHTELEAIYIEAKRRLGELD